VVFASESTEVSFDHTLHESIPGPQIGCAGCHSHEDGRQPITGSVETCGLCHQEELATASGEACRSCHIELTHDGQTSQGVTIPHGGFTPFAKGCLRCHYQVSEPVAKVGVERCVGCHEDRRAVVGAGIGSDLHPSHSGVACTQCHETDMHHIEAMSSAVLLRCADCHTAEHDVSLTGASGSWSATCNGCHTTTHAAEQALVVGILPDRDDPRPTEHFSEGLTCSSCHAPQREAGTAAGHDAGYGCEDCHRSGYETIERWWREGVRSRLRAVEAYLGSAEAATGSSRVGPEESGALRAARTRLDLVRHGYGAHNVYLAHDVFLDVVGIAEQVLEAAGRQAPKPDLGQRPREGFCSYCHYDPSAVEDPDPSFVFHRD
jgi:hypothetical protein